MPVRLMKSGSSKGGFSKPRLPCRYFRLAHQCLGTWTVLRQPFRCTRSFGSRAVTSYISTTSGRATSCFSAATLILVCSLSFFLDNFSLLFSRSSSSSSSIIRLRRSSSAALVTACDFLPSSAFSTVMLLLLENLKCSNTLENSA
ncbi:hypothetical protein BpHYR1_009091 [Brachionus plicatilis]|uniref:Uncharacterized protein n=1 Tax=Brachionus plicatilis TaxID=10195 RepID=A0A3M7QNE5_BRAPC|nr:hypothetical protein BpHYR1_009091 [Brachionus plicatilis]